MSLEEYRRDMEMCSRCSLCKFIPLEKVTDARYTYGCPSIARYDFNAYSGGGRVNSGLALLDGRFEMSAKVAEIAYACLMCGACDVSCKYAMDMEVLGPLGEMRAECVNGGHTVPALDEMVRRLRSDSLTFPRPVSGRRLGAAQLGVKNCSREPAKVLYHLGCRTAGDESLWPSATKAAALLSEAGVDIGVLGEAEICCGGRALECGYTQDFAKQAERFGDFLEESGTETMVTGCAHCFHAFAVQYPAAGKQLPVRVLHLTQYLAELLQAGRLRPHPPSAVPLKVTYQDPCHLGRLGEPFVAWTGNPVPGHRRVFDPPKPWRRGTNGAYEPPRALLGALPSVEVVEMPRTKEYAWCCGGGGGVPYSDPGFASWTAQERLAEAESTGAEALVTACPSCYDTLARAASETGSSLRVVHLVDLLAAG
jgi:Fe-S oxidoreductase